MIKFNNPLSEYDLERGFIDKDELLKQIGEYKIYRLVFGFNIAEGLLVRSPFREDNNPGCTFYRHKKTNRLIFIDYARMIVMDCFSAVQTFYNLPSFYHTLKFIKYNSVVNNNPKYLNSHKSNTYQSKKLEINKRQFTREDHKYWSSYGITIDQLLDDCVYSVSRYKLSTKNGDIIFIPKGLCYSYNGFKKGRKKIYRPNEKKYRFISTCKSDDIGELGHLKHKGNTLIISKSYKDARVLRNKGLSCIWFQNEGLIPSENILKNLAFRFLKIVVFFDNDIAGINASIKIRDIINSISPNKATNLYLPENLGVKDPSDLYKHKGSKELNEFINNKLR